MLNAVQQLCATLGVAVIGTLLFQWLTTDGWHDATREIGWVAVGCYGLAFLAAFLLPKKAREQAAH